MEWWKGDEMIKDFEIIKGQWKDKRTMDWWKNAGIVKAWSIYKSTCWMIKDEGGIKEEWVIKGE